MKYGIKLMNRKTKMYEMLVFNNQTEAEECYRLLFNNNEIEEISDFVFNIMVANIINRALVYENGKKCKELGITHKTIRILDAEIMCNNEILTDDIIFVYEGRSIAV